MNHRKKENILLVVGRDDLARDYPLVASLKESLKSVNYRLIFYGPEGGQTSKLLDPNGAFSSWPSWIRKPFKALILIRYPSRWGYFFSWRAKDPADIAERCIKLKKYIKRLGDDKNIVILSRSSGGRISSLVADESGICKVICIGYPFKHPQKIQEPERYAHLEYMHTPFLIFQGMRDEYGGLDVRQYVKLSPQVNIVFIDADHDFLIPKEEWDLVMERVRQFIA